MDLVATFIDGIELAGHSVVIALGVTLDGTKTPLGIWAGSTENTVVATALLQNLVERGLPVHDALLFIIDGGKPPVTPSTAYGRLALCASSSSRCARS